MEQSLESEARAGMSASTAIALVFIVLTMLSCCAPNAESRKTRARMAMKAKPSCCGSPLQLLCSPMELMHNDLRLHEWIEDQLTARSGEPFTMKLLDKPDMMVTACVEHFEEIFETQRDNFSVATVVSELSLERMWELKVTTKDGAWKCLYQVFLGLIDLVALFDRMSALSRKYVRDLGGELANGAAAKKPVDLLHLIRRYKLGIFGESGYGIDIVLKRAEGKGIGSLEAELQMVQAFAAKRMEKPTALWKLRRRINLNSEKGLREAKKVIIAHCMGLLLDTFEQKYVGGECTCVGATREQARKEVMAIIQRRVSSKKKTKTKGIVAVVVDCICADQSTMTPARVHEIVVDAVIAGRDVKEDTFTRLFRVLAQNLRVQAKLRAELLKKIPSLTACVSYVPSLEELDAVPYVEAVIRELLRLYPPASLVFTCCERDTTFSDGTFVPKDTSIMLSTQSAGRLKSVWGPDANAFVPERFLDPYTGKSLPVSTAELCAFRHGPKGCVGQTLALLEMKIMAAAVVSRFHLVPDRQQASKVCVERVVFL